MVDKPKDDQISWVAALIATPFILLLVGPCAYVVMNIEPVRQSPRERYIREFSDNNNIPMDEVRRARGCVHIPMDEVRRAMNQH